MNNEETAVTTTKEEAVNIETIDPRTVAIFKGIVKQTFLEIQKNDFRAEYREKTETSGEVPSDVATFVHIDEDKLDELDNPFELDVKGTITPTEAAHFKDVNYALALTKLRNWAFFEVDVEKPDGTFVKEKVPVNLAQIDMLSKKRLNMGIFGEQSKKHISSLRAGAGMPPEDSVIQKVGGFFGWRRENRNQLEGSYGIQPKR